MKHVMCFGDSNTWGFIPGSGARYDEHTRWTGVLADELGDSWRIHEEGLNARESAFDSPYKPFLNGLTALPTALVSQKPLDLLIIALGTNDLKTHTVRESCLGVERLIRCAQTMDALYPAGTPVFAKGPKILVVSPVAITSESPDDALCGKYKESLLFPKAMAAICTACGVQMLDAQQFAEPSPVDGVHMEPKDHHALGLAIAQQVRRMMED